MQEQQAGGPSNKSRKRWLWPIVIAHLLIVIIFFVATFLWGNFT